MGKCFPLVRGRIMRVTRLDACGRIAPSGCSAIATKGFVSVALTANVTESDEIAVQNAAGENCVYEPSSPTLNGYGVQVTFCDVNPELYAMMTNQSVVFDGLGIAVGFRVNTGVDVKGAGFALEVWSNVPGVVCDDPNAGGSYGYTLLPFISGGVLGDFTIENGAVTFVLQNAATKDGTGWGVGPYDVVPDATGTASPLLLAMDPKDHLHVQYTTIAPPEPSCDCTASGPPATTATAGNPGTWGPADSYPPANLTALQGSSITADPTTAWTAGQHVVLGDGSKARWTGTAWAAA
jgi:hypothetical protein